MQAEPVSVFGDILSALHRRISVMAHIVHAVQRAAVHRLQPALQCIGIVQSLHLVLTDQGSCQRAVFIVFIVRFVFYRYRVRRCVHVRQPVLGLYPLRKLKRFIRVIFRRNDNIFVKFSIFWASSKVNTPLPYFTDLFKWNISI